jgi:hypothetical protein
VEGRFFVLFAGCLSLFVDARDSVTTVRCG